MSMPLMSDSMHNAAEVLGVIADATEQGLPVAHMVILLRDFARLMEAGAVKVESLRTELAATANELRLVQVEGAELRRRLHEAILANEELKRRNGILYELSNRVRDQAVEAENKLAQLQELTVEPLRSETTMIMLDGKSFHCVCGCKIFAHATDQTLYVCNACGEKYEGS